MHPNGDYRIFIGTASGLIPDKNHRHQRFRLDPIFRSDELGKSFGEATLDEKHRWFPSRAKPSIKPSSACSTAA
jgi:inosine/xanthosine triphosphate pyrophosphatase family protein